MCTECISTKPARRSITYMSQLDQPFLPHETSWTVGSTRFMARAHRLASETYSCGESEPTWPSPYISLPRAQ